jgi:hypothetical protein
VIDPQMCDDRLGSDVSDSGRIFRGKIVILTAYDSAALARAVIPHLPTRVVADRSLP